MKKVIGGIAALAAVGVGLWCALRKKPGIVCPLPGGHCGQGYLDGGPLCWGDPDGDGFVTTNDSQLIFNHLISPETYPLEPWQLTVAKVLGYENLTVGDGRQIFMYLVYGEDLYPICPG